MTPDPRADCGHAAVIAEMWGDAVKMEATIATLRDALDWLVRSLTNPTPQPGDLGRALSLARAALAAAKGTTDG